VMIDLSRIPACSESDFMEALAYTQKYAPSVTPLGWRLLPPFPVNSPMGGMPVYQRIGDRLAVIVSASRWPGDVMPDRVWLHVSLSRPNQMPSYQDMCEVKALFIGSDRRAIQIFAEASQHINIHDYCLHLWCSVEGNLGFPDFGAFGTI
jgi:hypothetical protein